MQLSGMRMLQTETVKRRSMLWGRFMHSKVNMTGHMNIIWQLPATGILRLSMNWDVYY